MKRPDPARFMGSRKSKVDTLEMKGFSDPTSNTPNTPERKKFTQSKTTKRTEVLLYDRTSERTNVRNVDRVKIRHAFDIYEDQLRELHTRQLEAVRAGKKKPGLGTMVQKALDEYIENNQRNPEGKRTSGRTDEPSNERTNDQI